MNNFQRVLVGNASGLLSKYGVEARFEEVGVNERYLHFGNAGLQIDIWIYDDEVAFKIGAHHLQCEKEDFDSESEMVDFYLAELDRKMGELQLGRN